MDAIAPSIQSLLDLFTTALVEVRFADVNAQTLAHAVADVEAASEVVTIAQSALDDARQALQERQETLLQHAQRAVAYARVYAESDEALSARLGAIALPRSTRRTRPNGEALVLSSDPPATPARPRGRPRKTAAAEPEPRHPQQEEALLLTVTGK
jgi:hypothetical protein